MKKVLIAIAVTLVATAGIALIVITSRPEQVDRIFEPSEENGEIPEKILGDIDTAKVVVYEYGDYSCHYCADWNDKINALLEKYSGKMVLVFRGYDLGFQNGRSAALAATAAQLQGYWNEYKDILFERQSDWASVSAAEASSLFVSYFAEASGGYGNNVQFRDDMRSKEVDKRVSFENKLGIKAGVDGTPTFHINGKQVSLANLEQKIEEKCKD